MTQLLDCEFHELAKILLDLAGITVSQNKKYLFTSRLNKRLQFLNLSSYGAYAHFLRQNKKSEAELFINCMTTNLSYFFREPHHFLSLTAALASSKSQLFKIGSFGCSTGEEPVSISITLLEAGASSNSFQVFASDIDTEVLAFAKKGVYCTDKVSQLKSKTLIKYFSKNEMNFSVNQDVMSSIIFKQANLTSLHSGYAECSFDAIFCRNTLIYFSPDGQKQTVNKLAKLLKPGGLLCLGHAELLTDPSLDLFL